MPTGVMISRIIGNLCLSLLVHGVIWAARRTRQIEAIEQVQREKEDSVLSVLYEQSSMLTTTLNMMRWKTGTSTIKWARLAVQLFIYLFLAPKIFRVIASTLSEIAHLPIPAPAIQSALLLLNLTTWSLGIACVLTSYLLMVINRFSRSQVALWHLAAAGVRDFMIYISNTKYREIDNPNILLQPSYLSFTQSFNNTVLIGVYDIFHAGRVILALIEFRVLEAWQCHAALQAAIFTTI